MPKARLTISLTEMEHFRVLVDFLNAVDERAADECDLVLRDMVEDCRERLREASS